MPDGAHVLMRTDEEELPTNRGDAGDDILGRRAAWRVVLARYLVVTDVVGVAPPAAAAAVVVDDDLAVPHVGLPAVEEHDEALRMGRVLAREQALGVHWDVEAAAVVVTFDIRQSDLVPGARVPQPRRRGRRGPAGRYQHPALRGGPEHVVAACYKVGRHVGGV